MIVELKFHIKDSFRLQSFKISEYGLSVFSVFFVFFCMTLDHHKVRKKAKPNFNRGC